MNPSLLRSKILYFWISSCVVVLGYVAAVAGENNYLTNCPIKKGDSVARVKEFYRIVEEPKAVGYPRPPNYSYSYHFAEYGVWIFFDSGKHVQSLRFDHPFSGNIESVSIGNSKQEVLELKGEPAKELQGLPDSDALEYRKKRKAEVIDNLPDPAPKDLVRNAFNEMAQTDSRPLQLNVGWLYQVTGRGLLRYDFGSLSGKVQSIFSDAGTDETPLHK